MLAADNINCRNRGMSLIFVRLGRVLLCAVVQFIVVSGVSPTRCAYSWALVVVVEPEWIVLGRIPRLEDREFLAQMAGLFEVYQRRSELLVRVTQMSGSGHPRQLFSTETTPVAVFPVAATSGAPME